MKLLARFTLVLCASACTEMVEPEVPLDDAGGGPTFTVVAGGEVNASNNAFFEQLPAVSGDRVVWQDDNQHCCGTPQVYVFDASTGSKARVTFSPGGHTQPAIAGTRIAWRDFSTGSSEIFMMDLAGGGPFPVTSDGRANSQFTVALDGTRAVWLEQSETTFAFRLGVRDVTGGPTTFIPGAPFGVPAISGDLVVWTDGRNAGNHDIYLYDLSTNMEHVIATGAATQQFPDVSGNQIVWEDDRNGDWDIYLCEWSGTACTETQITTDGDDQRKPRISGNRIVWEDTRTGNLDLFLHDLAAGTEQQLTTHTGPDFAPDIDGDRIAWAADRGGQRDIFTLTIREQTPAEKVAAMQAELAALDDPDDEVTAIEEAMLAAGLENAAAALAAGKDAQAVLQLSLVAEAVAQIRSRLGEGSQVNPCMLELIALANAALDALGGPLDPEAFVVELSAFVDQVDEDDPSIPDEDIATLKAALTHATEHLGDENTTSAIFQLSAFVRWIGLTDAVDPCWFLLGTGGDLVVAALGGALDVEETIAEMEAEVARIADADPDLNPALLASLTTALIDAGAALDAGDDQAAIDALVEFDYWALVGRELDPMGQVDPCWNVLRAAAANAMAVLDGTPQPLEDETKLGFPLADIAALEPGPGFTAIHHAASVNLLTTAIVLIDGGETNQALNYLTAFVFQGTAVLDGGNELVNPCFNVALAVVADVIASQEAVLAEKPPLTEQEVLGDLVGMLSAIDPVAAEEKGFTKGTLNGSLKLLTGAIDKLDEGKTDPAIGKLEEFLVDATVIVSGTDPAGGVAPCFNVARDGAAGVIAMLQEP